VAGSWDIYYLHLATAVEHLVKGVLASVHPSFIADPRGDFDSLLHLTGMGHLARTPDFAGSVRTISVGEALRRVGRVVDGYQEPGDYVHVLLETRNGIVHAGYGVRQESEVVLGDVARYLAPLLVKAGMTDSAYWGDARDLVAQHADRRLNDIEAAYGRAIQAARDRYALRVKEMSEIRDLGVRRGGRTEGTIRGLHDLPGHVPCV
jgi:hypothetical protein